jgi:hypothetical protein
MSAVLFFLAHTCSYYEEHSGCSETDPHRCNSLLVMPTCGRMGIFWPVLRITIHMNEMHSSFLGRMFD